MARVPVENPPPANGVIPEAVKQLTRQLAMTDPAPPPEERSGGLLGYLAQRDFLYGVGGNSYSSRRITINQRYEMRADAIIALSNLASMTPMLTAKIYVRCRNPQKAAGLEQAIKRIYHTFVVQAFEAANFGWQAMVKEFGLMRPDWLYIDRTGDGPQVKKVWDNGDIPMLVWEPFVTLRPETVEPLWNAAGRFDGIRVSGNSPLSFITVDTPEVPMTGGGGKKIPVERSLWVVNQRHANFGSIWGHPRTAYAFPYWRAGQLVLRILERAAERKGDPLTIVTYPQSGTITIGGKQMPNEAAAKMIARQAKAGTILVMPSDLHDDGTGKGTRQWNVEYVRAEEKIETLITILEYLDTMKIRSMGLMEQGLIEGRGGTSSRNVAAEFGDRNVQTQFPFQTEILETINRHMIPQLSEQNWPWARDEPAELVAVPFGSEGTQILARLLESMANADPSSLPIDYGAALEYFEIPTLNDPQAVIDAQQRIIDKAKKEAIERVAPDANGNAGREADTGFYYPAPERITLSLDDGADEVEEQVEVLAALPSTRHYEDGRVLAQVVVLRKTWFSLLTDQYESFARFLEADADVNLSDADLADEDPAKRKRRVVNRIVESWQFDRKAVARAAARTSKALSSIFARAGRLELGKVGASQASWNPEEKRLADWLASHTAGVVTKIEKTTRKQLAEFLLSEFEADRTPKQIADNLRRHFSEFPTWRADLIAREETARAYRAATLFAAEAAGIKQVQAIDGRIGPTDRPCEVRNGNLYSVSDAFRENNKEHVRGTLAWRLVPSKVELSVERVEPEDGDTDWATRVDLDGGKILVNASATIDPEEIGSYLVMAVDYVESRAR